MSFYHDLITEKSWQWLKELRKEYDFILIGGWAVFLYTQGLKSKDIDLVLDYQELEKIRKKFEVSKNERLKKYKARREEVEIDIYLPFYSNPGLPAEDLKKFVISLQGFKTVEVEVLSILKQKALSERKESVKGRKDLIDLVSLFRLSDFDWQKYKEIVLSYDLSELTRESRGLIKRTVSLEEIGLNVYQMARLKKKILS